MSRIRLAALVLLLAAIGAIGPASSQANMAYELASALSGTSIPIAISTATTTQLIAAPTGLEPGGGTQQIIVQAYEVMAAGTGNFQFVYGTQTTTPCDTGQTALSGTYALTVGLRIHNAAYGAVLFVPAGKQLCAVTSAAVGMNGTLAYRIR